MMESSSKLGRVVDAHAHIASHRYTPQAFIDGVIDNLMVALEAQPVRIKRSRLQDQYMRTLQDHECDELVKQMDAADIEQTVLLVPDFTYALPGSALTIEEMLVEHAAVLKKHAGRLIMLAGVDPRWEADGVRLFERAITEYGAAGLKLYPPCGYSPSDRLLDPFYELCDAHNLPVLLHTGPTSPALSFDTAKPMALDNAARRFPRVKFILAHGAVSFVEEAVAMSKFRPNVYLDVSGFDSALRKGGRMPSVDEVFEAGIAHKVLFGTDWPVFRMNGTQGDLVSAFATGEGPAARLSATERSNVMRGNAARLFKDVQK
jgi:uncharacterized protein